MKGEILTLLLLLALGWTSCSNEEAIPGTEGGEDVTLSVDFQSAESMETKADADAEKTISNRFIAAFRGEECTGITFDSNNTNLKIKAKTGDVTFIAIANANAVPGLKAIIDRTTLPTYEELKALTTVFSETSKETMIKVTEDKRTGIKLEDSSRKFVFRLFQLQAKVTFKVSVAEGKGEFTVTNYKIDGINQTSTLVLSDTLHVTNGSFAHAATLDNGTNSTFVTYERITNTTKPKRLTMTVTGDLKLSGGNTESNKTYTMVIDPTSSNGGIDGIVHGWHYDVTGTISVQNPSALTVTIKAKPWDECGVNVDYGDSDK